MNDSCSIIEYGDNQKIYCYNVNTRQVVLEIDDKYAATNLYGSLLFCYIRGTDIYDIETKSFLLHDSRILVRNMKSNNSGDYYVNQIQENNEKYNFFLVTPKEEKEIQILPIGIYDKYDVSKDGKRVVVEGWDDDHKIIKVHNVENGALIGTLDLVDVLSTSVTPHVKSIRFSEDNNYITISIFNGKNVIWHFPPIQEVINIAREKLAGSELTTKERQKFLIE